ncbi:unnamed protein product [Phaeothamnion confervicola]
MVVDSTGYIVAKGARALRGLTLWGKIQNLFSDEPLAPHAEGWRVSAAAASYESKNKGNGRNGDGGGGGDGGNAGPSSADSAPSAAEGFICPECRRGFPSAEDLLGHHAAAHRDDDVNSDGGGGGDGGRGDGDGRTQGFGGSSAGSGDGQAVAGGQADGSGDGGPTRRSSWAHGRAELLENAAASRANSSGGGGTSGSFSGSRGGGGSSSGGFGSGGGGSGSSGGGSSGGGQRQSRLQEQRAVLRAQSEYVDALLPAVTELHGLGVGIGHAIDGQAELAERLAAKTDAVGDKTAFVTRQASRLNRGARKAKAAHERDVALQEVSTGLFLTVAGEEAALVARRPSNVCRWRAHRRQTAGGIWGFQSAVSGLWLGQGPFGGLKVRGKAFKNWEEVQCDLNASTTRLIVCSADWGKGGYVCRGAARGDDGGGGVALTVADAGIKAKERAAVFRVVDFEGYADSPFPTAPLVQRDAVPAATAAAGAGAGAARGPRLPPASGGGGDSGRGGGGGGASGYGGGGVQRRESDDAERGGSSLW